MSSAKSYFNVTLYRKHLTRFWPIWALYTIIWIFVLPLNLILNDNMSYFDTTNVAAQFANKTVLELLPDFGMGMAVFFSLLAAMAIWSYLYNNRSAGLIHALPIRREGLFFTGFLAGVTFFIVPNAVIFLLTLGAEAMAGAVNLGALALWFAVQSMFCLLFFCFATICGFVTGHILVLPAFYVIFHFLTIGILSLVEDVLHNFVYGFAGLTNVWPVAEWLSPLYKLVESVNVSYVREYGVITGASLNGVSVIVRYTIAGLVLAAMALLLYRRHQVERAGEVVTAGWLRPVFKYGVAFCGAMAFGSMLNAIFHHVMGSSVWEMLGFFLVCGFLSYLAAEMLLQKSFRVLKKSWKGCAVFLLVLVAATAAMELDLTGYEKRVPDAAEVQSVTLSNVNSAPYDSGQRSTIDAYDPALIARIVSLHRSAVENKDAVQKGLLSYYRNDSYDTTDDGVTVQVANSVNFDLSYTMRNGQEISRSYSIPVTRELLADPVSPAALLEELLNNRASLAGNYFPKNVTASDFIDGSVSFCDVAGDGAYEEVELTAAEAGIIYEAAMKDLMSGALGRRYLIEDRNYYTQVYQNEISLTFYGMFPGWTMESNLSLVEMKPDSATVRFYIQTDSVNLIAALRELNILDESHTLVTQMEQSNGEKGLYQ